jgi:hypothetical protein
MAFWRACLLSRSPVGDLLFSELAAVVSDALLFGGSGSRSFDRASPIAR